MYVELLVAVACNTSAAVAEDLKALIRENNRENDEFSNLPRDGKLRVSELFVLSDRPVFSGIVKTPARREC
jgi:hypothetical protein